MLANQSCKLFQQKYDTGFSVLDISEKFSLLVANGFPEFLSFAVHDSNKQLQILLPQATNFEMCFQSNTSDMCLLFF